jgi:hypothetical protein
LNIILPEIIQAFLTIPTPKQVDHLFSLINAHCVPAAFTWDITIRINTVQSFPDGVWLAGMEVCVKEACFRQFRQEGLGGGPVALENEGGV